MKKKLILIFIAAVLIILPSGDSRAETNLNLSKNMALTAGDLLSPQKWLEMIKQNVSVPVSSNQQLNLPNPQESLQKSSPQLKEINSQVRESVGIDFAKLIGWFAQVLGMLFQIIVNMLNSVADVLRS